MAPLQLHETNEGLQGMISAFNGLTKIKTTPTPFAVRVRVVRDSAGETACTFCAFTA